MKKYNTKFIHVDPHTGDRTAYYTNEPICGDVVRGFYYFLLSASYGKDSIINAMRVLIEDNCNEEELMSMEFPNDE